MTIRSAERYVRGTVYLPPMLRNHYYAVCCLMRNDGKIAVEYLVADWDDAPAWDDMEFAYPTYDNPLMPLSGSVADMKNPTVYCSLNDTNPEAGDFSVEVPHDMRRPSRSGSHPDGCFAGRFRGQGLSRAARG